MKQPNFGRQPSKQVPLPIHTRLDIGGRAEQLAVSSFIGKEDHRSEGISDRHIYLVFYGALELLRPAALSLALALLIQPPIPLRRKIVSLHSHQIEQVKPTTVWRNKTN